MAAAVSCFPRRLERDPRTASFAAALKVTTTDNWRYFELLLGHICAAIRTRTQGGPGFQSYTQGAVIAVRGTRFDVEVNRHQATAVDVFDGLVEVAGQGIPGTPVLVAPEFSTRVGVSGVPEKPTPTEELRPDVEAPERAMEAEFISEKKSRMLEARENELGEPLDAEALELEDEEDVEALKSSRERGNNKFEPPPIH